jgi:hypothetical protein
MTKSISTKLALGVAALALAACSGETASTSADDTAKKAEMAATEAALCTTMGPQTPRDISSKAGLNTTMFGMAPASTTMNLCNIHSHTNAEHKGPGFEVFVNNTDNGGFACNGTADLTAAEKAPYAGNDYKGANPGDTIEVHWVHTTCDTEPGESLAPCVSCDNPTLRVETQVFLVVNDRSAADFMDYAYGGNQVGGLHQPKSLPTGTGTPVQFLGSTTGPSYTQSVCSPAQVTWSVRPQCQKLDVASLDAWAESGNVFNETKSHGVRQLVTAPELLSQIK